MNEMQRTKKLVTKLCDLPDCTNLARSSTSALCDSHYMRLYRKGTTDKKQPKPDIRHTGGYVRLHAPDHPLTKRHTGPYEYEHRVVFYDAHGEGPFPCRWCSAIVTWTDMHVDHLNDIPADNRLENLVAACAVCNQKRGRAKVTRTMREKFGKYFEWNGQRHTLGEWAALIGVTRQSLMWRLRNGWTLDRVLTEGRGRTGPKRSLQQYENRQTAQGGTTMSE